MIRVLIVEDDPMVAEFNRRYVEMIPGFLPVAIAASAEEALRRLEEQSVDLILLDLFMPGSDGLALLARLRARQQAVDVIVISAARDGETINKALRGGVVDYIIKPFEFERLQAALANFKIRHDSMRDDFNQSELDRHVLRSGLPAVERIPKGLDKHTARSVWQTIKRNEGPFTAGSMAKEMGMSRVTMGKYLEYLEKIRFIRKEIGYGSVGRPAYQYYRMAAEEALLFQE